MTTLLLARHVLRTMLRQRSRSLLVALALGTALAVIIGVLAFVSSIEDSYRARGEAIRGVADLQVQAIGQSTFSPNLKRRLAEVPGTRFAVALTGQRVTVRGGGRSAVATAFGVDRDAKKLRSALQDKLRVRIPKKATKGGLSISDTIARRLGVRRGDKVRIFAYTRSPRVRVARVIDVSRALDDVIDLPRGSLDRLRGSPGRPNLIYVRLKRGATVAAWRKTAGSRLPQNALLVTPASEQRELNHVIDFTVRSYTYVFGAVAITIAGLLIYVLQLMRLLERQEDAGLIRALGSSLRPLMGAEMLALALALLAVTPLGFLGGKAFASYLATQLPSYLTDVFNFPLKIAVGADVVAFAALASLAVGAVATIGALLAIRGPVAGQLGRAPQAGATATARMSPLGAAALTAFGAGAFGASFVLAANHDFIPASVLSLLGLGMLAPGLTAIVLLFFGRVHRSEGEAMLVARSALVAYQRRVAFSTGIIALGIAAVVPLQLLDHNMASRIDRLVGAIDDRVRRVIASDDSFFSVPMREDYVRQALPEPRPKRRTSASASAGRAPQGATAQAWSPEAATAPAGAPGGAAPNATWLAAAGKAPPALPKRPLPRYAQSLAISFTSYGDRKVAIFAVDSRKGLRLYGRREGAAKGIPKLRRDRNGVLIAEQMGAWSHLSTGDYLRLPTPSGPHRLKVVGVVEDISWPSGTIYLDIRRYRKLFRTEAINVLAVQPGHLRMRSKLDELEPVHVISGKTSEDRIYGQYAKIAQGLLAMRGLTVFAAIVAVGGIFATSVFARRREWGILRAMGMRGTALLRPLLLEALFVMVLGAFCGVLAGIASYQGPVVELTDSQGAAIEAGIALAPLLTVVVGAVAAGSLSVAISGWLIAHAPVTEALAYE